jgi:hypothetical protein
MGTGFPSMVAVLPEPSITVMLLVLPELLELLELLTEVSGDTVEVVTAMDMTATPVVACGNGNKSCAKEQALQHSQTSRLPIPRACSLACWLGACCQRRSGVSSLAGVQDRGRQPAAAGERPSLLTVPEAPTEPDEPAPAEVEVEVPEEAVAGIVLLCETAIAIGPIVCTPATTALCCSVLEFIQALRHGK